MCHMIEVVVDCSLIHHYTKTIVVRACVCTDGRSPEANWSGSKKLCFFAKLKSDTATRGSRTWPATLWYFQYFQLRSRSTEYKQMGCIPPTRITRQVYMINFVPKSTLLDMFRCQITSSSSTKKTVIMKALSGGLSRLSVLLFMSGHRTISVKKLSLCNLCCACSVKVS